jgi:hypothetical protein
MSTLTKTEVEEKITQLEEAKEKIDEAVDLIRRAVEGTNNDNAAEAYIIPHLENWAEGNNPYDATTIPRLIEDLREELELIEEEDAGKDVDE